MARSVTLPYRSFRASAWLVNLVLIVAILYWAKAVLVPVALAVLLTFVLTPIVIRLDRLGLGRVPAVLLVVGLVVLTVAILAWTVASQLTSFAGELPNYRLNIREKIKTLTQGTRGGAIEKVQRTLEAASEEADESLREVEEIQEAAEEIDPLPVRVVADAEEGAFAVAVGTLLGLTPALEGLATAGFAFVLVLFMLINREDMRNRIVSLTAEGNLAVTTKALDDAAQRISRYLMMQLIVNGSFGIAVGLGLLWIGVPYALLWGLCAAVFRYIPYIGPWVAAILPLLVSMVTSPGWSEVLYVLGLFLVLELVSNNLMEPWLYGHNIGVSVVSLLVSAAFWTWVWGPIGLILATPMTVCLIVLGKYVPALAFLDKLLGDRPPLRPHAAYLQRLLAHDEKEAAEVVSRYRNEHAGEAVYDEVFVPALKLAHRDRDRGAITAQEEAFVLDATRTILAAIATEEQAIEAGLDDTADDDVDGEEAVSPSDERAETDADAVGDAAEGEVDTPPPVTFMGCASRHDGEVLTLSMLDQLIEPADMRMEILSTRLLPSQVIDRIGRLKPAAVVIAVLPPGGLVQARYLCKLIRKRFPEMWVIFGCWGYKGNLDRIMRLSSYGPHFVTTTLSATQRHLLALADSEDDSREEDLGRERARAVSVHQNLAD